MKIGIAGLGAIGQRHAANARKLGHEVRAYDPAAIGGSDFKREAQLYDWCDAAVICTPSMFHEGPLRACVERGKHALVEKPISTGVGMLRQLLTEAAYKRLTVTMGNNLRFHPCVKRAKDYVESGAIGTPRWANFICATEWTSTAARDGAILNTGSHEVDLALHLFGPAVPVTATCMINDAEVPVDLSADFVLEHDGGARSTFHLDIDTPTRVRQFWLSGTDKSVQFDIDLRTSWSHIDMGTYLGGTYADDYLYEMRCFTDRIEGKDVPGATGEDGLECLRLLLDIRKKAGLP